jgi:pimeloyl-ACP methyl ester carboxylesterase
MDLLTRKEEEIDTLTGQLRFNIAFLASRLIGATEWLKNNSSSTTLAVGYFGASTGAAATLVAAAKLPDDVNAVVSRGGRPDLAMQYLSRVKAPTLFIVGANDEIVVKLNNEAMRHLQTEKRLEIVTGASHLFEEPRALEKVAELAADWFLNHLQRKWK